MDKILQVRDLKTYFTTSKGTAKAVDGVSFDLYRGESFGIVGESGSGKSVTALSILQLLSKHSGKIVGGEIIFNQTDLTKLSDEAMQKIRGKDIAMIFQEPMTSLNPVLKIGIQITEALLVHKKVGSKMEAFSKAEELLKLVEIPDYRKRIHDYPHQLSGGMRQRVMIAIALACEPKILIADEPTTALDVTVQASILQLMKQLIQKANTSIILITHDLGVIAEFCNRAAVMYAGQIVEIAAIEELFNNPVHPYTQGLLESIPGNNKLDERLKTIEGIVPSAYNFPEGCRFYDRCSERFKPCFGTMSELKEYSPGHYYRCHLERGNA